MYFVNMQMLKVKWLPADSTDSGDDSSSRNFLFSIKMKCGQLRKFKEWRTGIQKSINSIPSDEFTWNCRLQVLIVINGLKETFFEFFGAFVRTTKYLYLKIFRSFRNGKEKHTIVTYCVNLLIKWFERLLSNYQYHQNGN